MNNDDYIRSIAYCGLVCRLCYLAELCDGCKSDKNICEYDCSDEGCYQRICCQKKGFHGCWECPDILDCKEGIYEKGKSEKIKAFAYCIQKDGMKQFMSYILKNAEKGFNVEKGGNYDLLSFDQILTLLRTGKIV